MFRQLNFRSFFNFLGRNKLYAAINIFGLSVSLMFVILIADYTLRQLTCDDYHAKADRIYVIGNEERITSGYYLQKYLRDRYPEIESTCAVAVSGQSTDAMQPVEAGQGKYSATILFADTTFFRIFDFELLEGDREQALASRDNVVLSESFARKVFGTFNPMGQVIRFPDEEKSYVVSGVVRDIDRSVIPNMDIIMRAERLCDINSANDERMSNSGAVTTFILARPGADLTAKIPDMLDYFKEIYWIYKGNVYQHVTLTPLRDVYFLSQNNDGGFNYGSWPFVMILFGVGAVILLFAVMNYINLTVAQTGFRAKEMAARRLLGASRGEIILKLILESTFLCVVAFVIALFLAAAVEPGASRLLGSKIGVWQDMTPAVVACYAAFIVVLGVVAGFIPAMMVSRYKPVDIVRGSFRHRTKMFYSKVLITIQNVITIVLIATSLASFVGTALMALLANYPFALAPGMGLNAYFSYTVVLTMGYSWQLALMAVFVEGIIFIVLSLTNVREGIFNAIPMTLKSAVSVGIGLFVAFVGLQNAKLIVNSDSTLVTYQHFKGETFHSVGVGAILALIGVVITAILLVKRVKGGILYGILITWVLGILCELTGLYVPNPDAGMYSVIPTAFVSFDFSALGKTFGQVFKTDFSGFDFLNFFAVMFSFLFVDLFDTLGTLIGVASKADMLDEDGKLPHIKGALLADSIATCAGAVLGTSTTTTFVESASGVTEGGRTGLTAMTTGVLFLLATIFSPLFLTIPSFATAPALIIVGFYMMGSAVKIDFNDPSEGIPAFLTILAMPTAYSISEGIAIGVISWTLINIITGKAKEKKISPLMYVLTVLFILKYVFL